MLLKSLKDWTMLWFSQKNNKYWLRKWSWRLVMIIAMSDLDVNWCVWFMMWAYGVKSNCSVVNLGRNHRMLLEAAMYESSLMFLQILILQKPNSNENWMSRWWAEVLILHYFLNHTVLMLFYMTDRNVRQSMWNILIDKLHFIQDMHIKHYSFLNYPAFFIVVFANDISLKMQLFFTP